MPKGQKIVDWTQPENDRKLLLAIVKACDIPKKYDEIAAAFGGGVPSSCISTRITKLRSMTNDGKPAARNNAGRGNAKKSSGGNITPETDKSGNNSEEHSGHGDNNLTAPKPAKDNNNKVLSGRVTKPRASPRKKQAQDYKKMTDPFMEMDAKDEDGANIFGKPDKSEEEDSDASDEEFGVKKQFKSEEEVV